MHADPVGTAEPMRQTLGIALVFGALFFGLVVAMVKMDSDNVFAWSSVATIGALALPWVMLSKWAEAVLFLTFVDEGGAGQIHLPFGRGETSQALPVSGRPGHT